MKRIAFPNDIFSKEILEKLPRDFTLIYDDTKYECSTALIALLSPQIQILMLSDVFLNSYTIPDLPDELDGDFQAIADFLTGQSLEVTKNNLVFLFIISSILGISQIEDKLKDSLSEQLSSFSLENLINQTIFLYKYNGDIFFHVKILANYFLKKISDDEESESLYKSLPVPILDLIFQRLSNSKKSDEKAIDFIIDVGGRLLRHINLTDMKEDQLHQLIKGSKPANLNYLRKNLAEYFKQKDPKPLPPPKSKRFAFLGDSFSGVINDLSKKCKANPSSAKGDLITVTSSHHIKGNYAVNNIFEYTTRRSSFKTDPNAEMTFQIDFRNSRVQIDAYSIRSLPQDQGSLQPTNWKIFGSDDGDDWDLVDEQRNVILEQCPDTTKTFVLLKKTKKFRYVKFEHPPIKNDKFGLCVSGFELFGVFYDK